MIGAMGALVCTAACTFAGLGARDRCRERLATLEQWLCVLSALRLLLEEERLPIDLLLRETAELIVEGAAANALLQAADRLANDPSLTVADAFADVRTGLTQREDIAALEPFFRQLGTGTGTMRALAATQTVKRLELRLAQAQQQAASSGPLYARLGLLGGLTLSIALW